MIVNGTKDPARGDWLWGAGQIRMGANDLGGPSEKKRIRNLPLFALRYALLTLALDRKAEEGRC
jgi:hypothetical protein